MATGHIHRIASIVRIGIYASVFTVLQCIVLYVPLTYAQYAAALFASNDCARSAVAAGAILFARPLYLILGIGRGITLLATITVALVAGTLCHILLYWRKYLSPSIGRLSCKVSWHVGLNPHRLRARVSPWDDLLLKILAQIFRVIL